MPRTYFFWDPVEDSIIQERDESGTVTAEYSREPDGTLISENRGGVERQYHFDPMGNTLALTDDNQNVTDTFAYNACGEVTERTGTTPTPYQYHGQQGSYRNSETGEYHVQGCDYSPPEGRWLSAVLIGDGANLYLYGHNLVNMIGQAVQEEGKPPPKKEIEEKCIVAFCATDIDVTKGIAKHLFIKLFRTVDGKEVPWAYRGGPSGADGVLAGCRCKGLEDKKFGQIVSTNGVYDDKFIDYLPPEKENCVRVGVLGNCEDLHKCYLKILERVDNCCIPYAPVPIPGAGSGNSNSVAYWLMERCGPALGPLGKVGFPGKIQIAVAPGWGIATPDCIKEEKKKDE